MAEENTDLAEVATESVLVKTGTNNTTYIALAVVAGVSVLGYVGYRVFKHFKGKSAETNSAVEASK